MTINMNTQDANKNCTYERVRSDSEAQHYFGRQESKTRKCNQGGILKLKHVLPQEMVEDSC